MAKIVDTKNEEVIAEVNIVPLVDIAFVLLIVFMLTSTTIIKAAIKVDLPQAAQAGDEVSSTINIIYTKNKELYLDGVLTKHEDAFKIISEKAKNQTSMQAVISADKGLAYGEVVDIVDMVKQAGINTFALNIERKP